MTKNKTVIELTHGFIILVTDPMEYDFVYVTIANNDAENPIVLSTSIQEDAAHELLQFISRAFDNIDTLKERREEKRAKDREELRKKGFPFAQLAPWLDYDASKETEEKKKPKLEEPHGRLTPEEIEELEKTAS